VVKASVKEFCEITYGLVRRIAITLLFASFVSMWAPTLIAQETGAPKTITLGTENYPPISNIYETGFEDLIAKEMFRRIGVKVILNFNPSERVLYNANVGIDDGILTRVGGIEKKYTNLVPLNESLFTADYVAFSHNKNIKISGWNSLAPLNIGIITGWKLLERNITSAKSLIRVKSAKQLFALLGSGRVDVIVFSRFPGLQMIRDQGLTGVTALEPPLAQRKRFFYLNKKNKALVPRATKALKAMKADGTYQKIFNQTILPLIRG